MENRKIKWGILGTGRIARIMGAALQVVENAELVAVGSRSSEKAKEFAAGFNIPKHYGTYEALMADTEIDVVYIATPHQLHLPNTLAALGSGKHVLCEKPMGVNSKELQAMSEKAKEKGLFLMEALWTRFLPHMIETKKRIENAEIGDIKLLTASFCFKSNNGPEHRHFNRELCGGSILDIGIYNFFLTLFLLGEPRSIKASAGLSDQGGDNSCGCVFNYDSDTLAVTHSSFMADAPVVAAVHGTKGKIEIGEKWFTPTHITITNNSGVSERLDFGVKCNGYEFEAQEVTNCILNGKQQSDVWSLADSARLMRLMDAVRKECGVVYPAHD